MPIKNSFDFELEEILEYAKGGEMEEAQMITLFAPTSRVMDHCANLKQAFFRAMPEAKPDQALPDDISDVEIDGDQIMLLITASRDVSLASTLATARELFTSKDIAMVDGEVKLTKPMLEQLSNDELERMLGQYLSNFILASALKKMKNLS